MTTSQKTDLQFLAPKSIAIIGASNKPEKRGYQAITQLQADGFNQHKIYPINPKAPDILGIKAYPSVMDVPDPIDIALVCTPAHSLPSVIADCGRKGIKGAVILAAGMSEMGEEGFILEQNMLAAAKEWNVRLVGPNTNGVFNLHCDLNMVGVSDAEKGEIGILSQSGNVMLAFVAEAKRKGGVGFSTYVGVGNQSDIRLSEYLEYFGDDNDTAVPAVYIEGFKEGDGRRFLDVARDVVQKKPVVVYKSGRTVAGQVSASSHTGSLAGSYQLTRDVLRQAGVTVVSESDKVLSVAETLGKLPLPKGNRVAILCDSGGHGTITTDALIEAGLQLAPLSAATIAKLKACLPPAAALNNPIDVAGATDEDTGAFADCTEILLQDSNVDVLMIVGMVGAYSVRFSATLLDNEMETSRRIIELTDKYAKPVIVQSVYYPLKPKPLLLLRDHGIPVFIWAEAAIRSGKELVDYAQARRRLAEAAPYPSNTPLAAGSAIFDTAYAQGRTALFESEAKQLLRSYGLAIPEEVVVRCEADLDNLPVQIADDSLAMKVVSKDILHKTDAGGVKLNVNGAQQRLTAYREIIANSQQYKADADIEGVLLAPMLKPGVEVILGVTQDPTFGPVMMFGLGGVFVEVLKDVVFRSIPLAEADAREMIEQIRAVEILNGVRGAKPVDREALVSLILKLSDLVWKHPEIAELDLNPVIANDTGCAIADARIILAEK